MAAEPHIQNDWKKDAGIHLDTAFAVAKRNARLSFWARAVLFTVGLVALLAAVVYALIKSSDIVSAKKAATPLLPVWCWPAWPLSGS